MLFLRVDPEHRALRAAPHKFARRSRHARDAGLRPHRHAEAEAEAVHVLDGEFMQPRDVDVRAELIGRHVLHRLAAEDPRAVEACPC